MHLIKISNVVNFNTYIKSSILFFVIVVKFYICTNCLYVHKRHMALHFKVKLCFYIFLKQSLLACLTESLC